MPAKKNPLMVAFVGTSGSGKTMAMSYLTSHLTKLGFKVGVAKHIHEKGFTIDTIGKDTWRHAQAGARMVLGVSPNEFALIKKTSSETNFEKVIQAFEGSNLDLILFEGFSSVSNRWRSLPKVITARNTRDLKYTLSRTPPPILAITGRVTREQRKILKLPAPLIDVEKHGTVLTSMVRRLLRPKELSNMLTAASLKHGGTCIGLAIGVRAAYLASNAFVCESLTPGRITCGTKQCIVEALKTIYPKARIDVPKTRNDLIELRSRDAMLAIRLTPAKKANFTGVNQVLRAADNILFESIEFARK